MRMSELVSFVICVWCLVFGVCSLLADCYNTPCLIDSSANKTFPFVQSLHQRSLVWFIHLVGVLIDSLQTAYALSTTPMSPLFIMSCLISYYVRHMSCHAIYAIYAILCYTMLCEMGTSHLRL